MSDNTLSRVGFLLINKPAGQTSHQTVARLRRLTGIKRIGHTGTLDPLATGLLILVLGSSTRLIEYTHDWPKTYQATVTLGTTSTTDDAQGVIQIKPSVVAPEPQTIEDHLTSFIGTFFQTPPAYAAIKVKGKKLYEYARKGESVVSRPRQVTISTLKLLDYHYPQLELTITCSTGTYIRALARDLGVKLGTGGYISALCRTTIGPWSLEQAKNVADITSNNWANFIQPPENLVTHLPSIVVETTNVAQLQQGRAVPWLTPLTPYRITSDKPIALFTPGHKLFGIGQFNPTTSLLSPQKIINN